MATEEVNLPLSLPPYPEIILEAIAALNENNGSNKTSISKYIESKHGDLPTGHSTLLSHHLNKMKDTGELVFWKNNYMKAGSNAPPRRGRGRPPKPKDPLTSNAAALDSSRPKGHPLKDPDAPPKPGKPKVAMGSGKPRGRPRKMAKPSGGMGGTATTTVEMATGTGRPRGRPPKVKPAVNGVSVEN